MIVARHRLGVVPSNTGDTLQAQTSEPRALKPHVSQRSFGYHYGFWGKRHGVVTSDKILRIGGASGYWGDAARATPQLLNSPGLDYIVYDYLAEITMSIMARARATDESKGYALDFISAAMQPNLGLVAERGIKVISNAGGVNPKACAAALRAVIAEQNLELKIACVLGDDLMPGKGSIRGGGAC